MLSAGPVLHEYAGWASCLLEYSAQTTCGTAHATCGVAHTTCCAADAAKGAGYRTPHNRTTCIGTTCIGTTCIGTTYGPRTRDRASSTSDCYFNSRTGGAAFACVVVSPAAIRAATATNPVVILRIVPSLKSGALLAEPSVHAERTTWMTCASSRCYTHPARGKAI